MEEEGGDDSEMIDAMDGWDSDQDDTTANPGAAEGKAASSTAASGDGKAAGSGGAGKIIAD
jgi:hypothetical protein